MSNEEREKMLDLLCDKFVYGLSEEDARELEKLGIDPKDAESIEQTVAALSLAGLDTEAEMPTSLQAKLMRDADEFFGTTDKVVDEPVPQRQIVLDSGPGRPWFGWLGWAVAAAACVTLAVTVFIPRNNPVAVNPPTPTPEERLTPAQQRQRLMDSPGQLVKAEWTKAKMDEITVSGDVVWNPEKQAGYLRLSGLPKNDTSKESYQLWIVDDSQNMPIDGGVFDITADGEVIIPIDARLKAANPKLFAITIEKAGGVVKSDMKKFAAQAPVKQNQV